MLYILPTLQNINAICAALNTRAIPYSVLASGIIKCKHMARATSGLKHAGFNNFNVTPFKYPNSYFIMP